jgi:DNA-binding Lrp family transcriptional regulator
MLSADFDALVPVRAPDNAALRELVIDGIQNIPSVLTTRTWLILDGMVGQGAAWS